jgi:hypothetical protein
MPGKSAHEQAMKNVPAAQIKEQIGAEIGEKVRFRMETKGN